VFMRVWSGTPRDKENVGTGKISCTYLQVRDVGTLRVLSVTLEGQVPLLSSTLHTYDARQVAGSIKGVL